MIIDKMKKLNSKFNIFIFTSSTRTPSFKDLGSWESGVKSEEARLF